MSHVLPERGEPSIHTNLRSTTPGRAPCARLKGSLKETSRPRYRPVRATPLEVASTVVVARVLVTASETLLRPGSDGS